MDGETVPSHQLPQSSRASFNSSPVSLRPGRGENECLSICSSEVEECGELCFKKAKPELSGFGFQ